MSRRETSEDRALFIVLLIFAACSLIHFVHNAEFLADYPNLPAAWSRSTVYLAWTGMTAVGVAGWLLASRGFRITGLMILAAYSALGLDSLGHYLVAPISAHTLAMNSTILLEVISAALVLVEVTRRLGARMGAWGSR